jgi:hypothetical protein
MTFRGAAVPTALAVIALAAAYQVSQRPAVQSTGDVKVLDLSKGAFQRVRYENGTGWVELTRAEEAGEDAAWLKTSARSLPPKPVLDGGVAEPPVQVPERELRGNKSALDLVNRFTPLNATRALGALSADKLKELALDVSKRKLTIYGGGKEYPFTVSTSSSAGAPYIRRDSDGQVYLLGGSMVADLDNVASSPVPGGRLVERALHLFKLEPDDVVSVSTHGKKRDLVVLAGTVPQTVRFATKGQTTADGLAKNWHDKLWRIPAQELLGKGETPAAGVPHDDLRIAYQRGHQDLGFIEMGRLGRDVYARTEHTAGWVKLPPTGEEVVLEAEKVVNTP